MGQPKKKPSRGWDAQACAPGSVTGSNRPSQPQFLCKVRHLRRQLLKSFKALTMSTYTETLGRKVKIARKRKVVQDQEASVGSGVMMKQTKDRECRLPYLNS